MFANCSKILFFDFFAKKRGIKYRRSFFCHYFIPNRFIKLIVLLFNFSKKFCFCLKIFFIFYTFKKHRSGLKNQIKKEFIRLKSLCRFQQKNTRRTSKKQNKKQEFDFLRMGNERGFFRASSEKPRNCHKKVPLVNLIFALRYVIIYGIL